LNLYVEALTNMPQNPQLPQLFRDILKDAFLPYRDSETLNLFLKQINGFTYDHSEKLGDAFEYLLSVLGSQGDAGQFRTPRHIIDFIVEAIDPKKNETILDPACGTAGFLISSYKHILKQNTKAILGDQLTPDDRKKLMGQFMGYDISPDMVRLSLVNMYLHGFPSPNVHEYDTLTSEERWDETYDIIMANPPFMSPKGGIRPHKRFSIQASRSEVLFVDYIAEHLNTHGRAGIIVPEGIIFQSGIAYKTLRKELVEKYLYAVVSLPAGVFNPYSGVKTSILLMDKQLAKKADSILFVKVENDGFDLGAQRRPIAKNDLPQALHILQKYIQALRESAVIPDLQENGNLAVVASKARIAKSGDYNLSGERYKTKQIRLHQNWSLVKIGDVCNLVTGGTPKSDVKEYYENGTIKWLMSGDIHKREIFDCDGRITDLGMKESNAKILPIDSVLIALNGQGKTRGTVALLRTEATCNQSLVSINPKDKSKLLSEYLFYVLKSQYENIRAITGDNQRSGLNMPIIKEIKIPLPPVGVQQDFIAELESYQKIIDGAKQVVENYRPHINISPMWKMVPLERIASVIGGFAFKSIEFTDTGIQIIKMGNVKMGELDLSKNPSFMPVERIKEFEKYLITKDDILITMTGTEGKRDYGEICMLEEDKKYLLNQRVGKFHIHNNEILPKYLFFVVQAPIYQNEIFKQATGIRQANISNKQLESISIPLPSLDIQEQIVSQIEEEQKLVESNKKLIEIFEQKIKNKLSELWESQPEIATQDIEMEEIATVQIEKTEDTKVEIKQEVLFPAF